jgi:hypothetical protein
MHHLLVEILVAVVEAVEKLTEVLEVMKTLGLHING